MPADIPNAAFNFRFRSAAVENEGMLGTYLLLVHHIPRTSEVIINAVLKNDL